MGAFMHVHDPYVDNWHEFETQDGESADFSWKRFFRNQDGLKDIIVEKDLKESLKGADAVIIAVPHDEYMELMPDQIVEWAGNPLAVIDCFGILNDDQIRRYFELGCEVKALGRGHIQRIKKEVASAKK
jgi:UDP-N-acetyl-D-mannosaminuronate dehydrogenase